MSAWPCPTRMSLMPSEVSVHTSVQHPLTGVRTPATCTDMRTARWELRLTPEELAEWKKTAEEVGQLPSEWVRSGIECEE